MTIQIATIRASDGETFEARLETFRRDSDIAPLIETLRRAGFNARSEALGSCSNDPVTGEHFHAVQIVISGITESAARRLLK